MFLPAQAHRDPFNVTKEEVDFESIPESEVVEREKDIPELQEIMQPLMPTRQPHIAQVQSLGLVLLNYLF